MNGFDYVLIAIVAVSVVTAAIKGFVYEIWMLAATVAAIGLAAWQYPQLAALLDWVTPDDARNFAAFLLIVAAVMIVAMAVGRIGRGAVHAIGLAFFDRALGAALGLVRGVALAAVVVMVLAAYPFRPALLQDSALAPRVLWASRAMASFMPSPLADRFHGLVAQEIR